MLPLAVFEAVIERWEGGDTITDDANDRGGLTRWGVSQRAHPSVDIANLTREQAMLIYDRHYWQAVRGDELPPAVALAAFDCAVNQGAVIAAKLLQHAVGASADGVLGPETMRMIKASTPAHVLERFMAARCARYIATPGFEHYGRGWLNRVIGITVAAMRLA